jgi:glycosyltransferase involved in cell wall biosynthesis
VELFMQQLSSLIFIRPVTQLGGAEKSTIALISEINKTHKVFVLDYYGSCPEYLELLAAAGIEYRVIMPDAKKHTIGGRNRIDRLFRMMLAYKEMSVFINKLSKILKEINPNAIWFSDDKSLYAVGKALEKNGDKTTTVMFLRGDIGKVKCICKKYWKRLHCIVSNNSISLNYYKKFPWADNKLKIAYNGVDFDAVRKASQKIVNNISGQERSFKVILPAMLIPLKAQNIAIKGFAEFVKKNGDAVLWLCGNTPNCLSMEYENSLKKLVVDLNLENKVYFLGWRKDIPALTKKADVMILTSTTEGLPRSILEAMAIGTPVIATKAGGVVDVINDGEDGMLIEIDDYNSLADKLLKLTDKKLRDKLSQNAIHKIENNFTIVKQANTFLNYISN